ncbi:MAG: 50S ribosomal protein L4 [Victivallales bacterium]|nr:50S ribosomal protein L4 [Victivallales bacterium]MBR5837892.1 50S ribosomal protein L4 [Victivallales bacterium]
MATLTVKNASGADLGTPIEIDSSWLEFEKGEQAVKDSVVAFLAGCRSGTASTKTRGEVSGGGAKPWRQKGNGRARAGSNRSPVWRGGAIVFGPKPRSYAKKVNANVETLALRRVFSDRVKDNEIIVVDDIKPETPKTKDFVAFLKAIGVEGTAVVLVESAAMNVIDDEKAAYGIREPNLVLASRNLGNVILVAAESVNPYTLMKGDKVVITSAGLKALGQRLAKKKER